MRIPIARASKSTPRCFCFFYGSQCTNTVLSISIIITLQDDTTEHSRLSSSSWASTPWRCLSSAPCRTPSCLHHATSTWVACRRRPETACRNCRPSSASSRQREPTQQRVGSRTVPPATAAHASAGRGSCWSDPRTPASQQPTVNWRSYHNHHSCRHRHNTSDHTRNEIVREKLQQNETIVEKITRRRLKWFEHGTRMDDCTTIKSHVLSGGRSSKKKKAKQKVDQ